MCGINGIFSFVADPGIEPAVRAMTAALTHRGPDDEGFLFDGPVGLGHRRLSIIDIAGGRQPIADENDRYWVILNGEIYNFPDLRRELESRHRFRTETDTEVLVHLYEERGEDFVDALNGMFALALWDAREHVLLLARDRLGIKPLYYSEQPDRIVFASEIKALLASGRVEAEVDTESLYDFLRLKYVPGPATIFRGVRRVEPGTMVRIGRGGVRRRRYWSLPSPQPPARAGAVIEEIRELLVDAVRRRLIADVPVGLLLSGGIDSSALLAVAHGHSGDGTRTFSVGFPEFPGFDETDYSRRIAARFGANHHELRAESIDLSEMLFRLTWHMDEPISDPAIFPTYVVCRHARGEVKVALSGEGADELFAGYNKYWKDRWLGRWGRLPEPIRSAALRLAAGRGADPGRRDRIEHRARMPAGIDRHLDWSALYRPDELFALSAGEFGPHHEERLQTLMRERAAPADGDHLDAALRLDLRTSLVDSLLMKVDKVSMATSLEVRVPYLDHRLVERAAALPVTWKLRGGDTKWVLKRATRRLLPRFIRNRPKHGFDVPVSAWLRGGLRETVRDCLASGSEIEARFLRRGSVSDLARRHLDGGEEHGERLWALLVLEAWLRTFVAPAGRNLRNTAT
jgi:asparagine synthase (glutamine-hydrolysing)